MSQVQPPGGLGAGVGFEIFYAATVQRTFDSVRRAAAGDKHLAGDATQEAYLAMWIQWSRRCLRSFADNQRYVVGIAMHKLIDAYRIRGREVELDGECGGAAVDDAEIARLVDRLSLDQAVRNLIAAQPPRRRLVGVLFFVEDHSYEEIAAGLDMTPSTVRTHVERLRRLLRPYIDGMGGIDGGGERS
jgi:RNA polymerase sigma factor (sigma-70 family)